MGKVERSKGRDGERGGRERERECVCLCVYVCFYL